MLIARCVLKANGIAESASKNAMSPHGIEDSSKGGQCCLSDT